MERMLKLKVVEAPQAGMLQEMDAPCGMGMQRAQDARQVEKLQRLDG